MFTNNSLATLAIGGPIKSIDLIALIQFGWTPGAVYPNNSPIVWPLPPVTPPPKLQADTSPQMPCIGGYLVLSGNLGCIGGLGGVGVGVGVGSGSGSVGVGEGVGSVGVGSVGLGVGLGVGSVGLGSVGSVGSVGSIGAITTGGGVGVGAGALTSTVTLLPSCCGIFTTILGEKVISGGSGH